uniref:Arachidonate 12-lipoxygenase n=1 Tax=Neolamprologus brichardi TaxID=32507 RepID=A0A3Q4GAF0_NEOBR
MEVYTVTVATGTSEYSGTNNYIYLTLVGENGESERTQLDNPGLDFCRGAVSVVPLRLWLCKHQTTQEDISCVTYKQNSSYLMCDPFFFVLDFISITALLYNVLLYFPVSPVAKTLTGDSALQLLEHRRTELQERQKTYRWVTWAPGIPRCIDAETEADLPQDARFDNEKRSDFEHSLHYALLELSLKKLTIWFGKSWDDLEDFKRIFWKLKSPIAEYCMTHWKEDWFFGYQCLNGSNPRMIQRCKKLPENLPVTADMVQRSMADRTNLDKELKAGNIYLLDYAIMDGIPSNTIKGHPQYIAAPICLLYQHPDEGLIPIAIQLEQTPGRDTPIFLPSDPPLAWLLAKMWVRHSEFQVFQLLSHLLRTHLVVEVFCVATLRQLPAVHPIYKLLSPHIRYTLEINCRGRTQLISANGIFKRVCHSTLGFNITDFYLCSSFVSSMVNLYYQSDHDVQEDLELQAWIRDITEEGLPSKLSSREELCTLLAVAIFTSTAQHAATNNGQFDWCAWIPNTPCTMRQPPPTDKDAVTMDMIMATLPDVSQSCLQMAITWHLGRAQPDAIPLGRYTEDHFTEAKALEVIDRFRMELKEIEKHILSENEGLELQYLFLLPSRIENSITI